MQKSILKEMRLEIVTACKSLTIQNKILKEKKGANDLKWEKITTSKQNTFLSVLPTMKIAFRET